MTDIVERLRSSAKAFRENTVYDSEGYPLRLIVQADEDDEAADTITALRAEVEALRGALSQAIGGLDADDLDQQICCSGYECGCQGSTNRQLLMHNLRAALFT